MYDFEELGTMDPTPEFERLQISDNNVARIERMVQEKRLQNSSRSFSYGYGNNYVSSAEMHSSFNMIERQKKAIEDVSLKSL